MGIKLEVELMMPMMPNLFRVKPARPHKLENAYDHLTINVSELDESAVEKICQQWSAEFRQHALQQRIAHNGPPKASTPLATRYSRYFGPDLEDDE
jgi:hypothetical protein